MEAMGWNTEVRDGEMENGGKWKRRDGGSGERPTARLSRLVFSLKVT